MQQKQQESSGSKKSSDELISNRDSVNTELQAVVSDSPSSMTCVAKAMKCEEKSEKRAAELFGNELEEALSTLSESALLRLLRPCIELPSMKP